MAQVKNHYLLSENILLNQ